MILRFIIFNNGLRWRTLRIESYFHRHVFNIEDIFGSEIDSFGLRRSEMLRYKFLKILQ